jgi:microcompartment protein CcmK/EutM
MNIVNTRGLTLNNERFKAPSKVLIYILILMQFLTGCGTTSMGKSGPGSATGPQTPSTVEKQVTELSYAGPKLDVIIPAFSPGLDEKARNYEEEGVWPELRQAEANRFAYKLKQALDETGKFAAVRVSPNNTASGDLYVLGKIVESNGVEVAFDYEVVDASGKRWLNDTINHEVSDGFYKNPRNAGKDAYDLAFDEAAEEIVQVLLKQEPSTLDEVKNIAALRFGASFNEAAFTPYLDSSSQPIKLLALPSDADPLYQRVQSVRVREQLFIDNLQQGYSGFSQQMQDSYLVWQESSFTETQLRKKAKINSFLKIVGGVLLVVAAVAVGASGNSQDNNIGRDATSILAGVGAAVLITSGVSSKAEAKMHTDAINELGQSVDLEMSPQVVKFDEETKELTGDVDEQFEQWRTFMGEMYELEATPETQL